MVQTARNFEARKSWNLGHRAQGLRGRDPSPKRARAAGLCLGLKVKGVGKGFGWFWGFRSTMSASVERQAGSLGDGTGTAGFYGVYTLYASFGW